MQSLWHSWGQTRPQRTAQVLQSTAWMNARLDEQVPEHRWSARARFERVGLDLDLDLRCGAGKH